MPRDSITAPAEPTATINGAAEFCLWRPAGVVFLVVSAAAVAAGAFPELLFPRHVAQRMTAPPALPGLMAAQAVFVMIFCTLLLRPRAGRGLGLYLLETVGEYILWLAVSVPLYVVAAWLSDATVREVIRGVLYLSAVAAGAWGLGLWFVSGRPAMMTAAVLVAVLAAAGLPVVYYLLAELAASPPGAAWLRWAGPATCAFGLTAARGGRWYPSPLWSWALWLAVGVLAGFARLVVSPRRD